MSEITSADLPGSNGISNQQALDTTELLSNPEIMKAVSDAVSADGDGGASITEGEQANLNKLMSTFAALRDGNLSDADRSAINGEASPQASGTESAESTEGSEDTAAASGAGSASALDAAPASESAGSDSSNLETTLANLLKSLEGKLSQEEITDLIEQIIKLFTGDANASAPSETGAKSGASALDAPPKGTGGEPAASGGKEAAPAGNDKADGAGATNTAPTLDPSKNGEAALTDGKEGTDTLTTVIEKAVDGMLSGKITAEDAAKVIAAAAEALKGGEAAGGAEGSDPNFMIEYKNASADGKIDENEKAHLDRLAADAGRQVGSSTSSTASTSSTSNVDAVMGMLKDMNLSDAEREQFNKSIKG